MATLTYNGITFGPSDWYTLSFSQEAIYDTSGTDLMYVKFDISGQALLATPLRPTAGDAVPATTLTKIRTVKDFMQPRKTLSFKLGTTEVIPTTSTVDAKNGPLPQYINVIEVTDAALMCNFRIIAHFAENSPNSEAGVIVSHRWTDRVEIDKSFYSRRTRQGKVVVSLSAFNSSKARIEDLRESLITTSIQKGFTRERSMYVRSENGLEMSYEIVDLEQFRLPPAPASDADGYFAATTQRMGSPGRQAMCSVTLRGPKKQEANPLVLMKLAIAIAYQKLRANGGFFPNKADFKEALYRNEVSTTLSGFIKPEGNLEKFMSLAASCKGIGIDPVGSDGGIQTASPDPGTRGTAGILLQAAAFHDPTLAQTLNKATNTVVPAGGASPVGMTPGG